MAIETCHATDTLFIGIRSIHMLPLFQIYLSEKTSALAGEDVIFFYYYVLIRIEF